MHRLEQRVATRPDPVDRGLEDALIAALAADPTQYGAVRAHLPATDASAVFAARREDWEVLVDAIESGASIDGFGLPIPPAVDPVAAAERLSDLYRRRLIGGVLEQALQDLASARPTRQVIEALDQRLAQARQLAGSGPTDPVTWGDALLERVTRDLRTAAAQREAGQRITGILSGLPLLDIVLDGWQRGGLYVVGGAPGIGKTSLTLQWAAHAALEQRTCVVYVTYENSPQHLAMRTIGRLAGVSSAAAEHGRADPRRWRDGLDRFRALAPRLAFIAADAGTSVEQIETTVRTALAGRSERGLLVVDYLQRMAYSERFGTLRDNVSALAQRLRDLAVRLDLPVLAVSALTPGTADDEPLRLSALAQRGELEYASDVVLLLGPRSSVGLASAARARVSPGLSMLDLLVAKNRYGESGRTLPLLFRPSTGELQDEPSI